ncbi:peptide-methionine (R)-S-oxide reductase MsrB [Methanogenium marinum]|uniref:peptide-methionine (R)-S-oxide reductase n=1 Tax=Methanogenium marinum TaxID=348610 RepID=A0A9Q4KTU7_9EURY|nr:peptide-methionine (R)-S-oxide reductase MsrB [Methanogenium marinum]MDE4907080.1 peptide-methionine (R)-S-oxide reductase MsrB [Methanogenium marinum]
MYSAKPIIRTDEEWKHILSPDVFRVARQSGTEPPFSGIYADCHDEGVYACACCKTHLFFSGDKFDSGTGWPSFSRPVHPDNTELHEDSSLGMVRTEVLCRRCKAHLGHVFDDGPLPDGMRYCMNSLSLSLVVCGTQSSDTNMSKSGRE